jgi:hypothetical protein
VETWLWFWVALSLVPAVLANARGRNPFVWFLVSLAISPLLASILVFVFRDLALDAFRHQELVSAARQPEVDALDRLERLAALRDRGAITSQEYEAKKAQLLDEV